MNNYKKVLTKRWHSYYLYMDSPDVISMDMLRASKLKFKIVNQYHKDEWSYTLFMCKIRSKVEKAFAEIMERLANRLLLSGYGDYLDKSEKLYTHIEKGLQQRKKKGCGRNTLCMK